MIVACKHCNRPFDYWEEGTKGWGPRQAEAIVCPYCAEVHGHHHTIGYVRSRPLTAEQREAYERSMPSDSQASPLFLTIAILTYNERDTLARVVDEMARAAGRLGRPFEILIVDDGSNDGSGDIADQLAKDVPEVRVIHHSENMGLGGVYRTVFSEARGEYLTSFPADGQFPPEILDAFGPLILSHDMVLGYLPPGQQNAIEKALSGGERWLYRRLLGPIPRFQGVFLIRRALIDAMHLQSSGRGWAVVMELIIKVSRQPGSRLVDVPITMIARESGQSKVRNLRTIVANFRQIARLRSIVKRVSVGE